MPEYKRTGTEIRVSADAPQLEGLVNVYKLKRVAKLGQWETSKLAHMMMNEAFEMLVQYGYVDPELRNQWKPALDPILEHVPGTMTSTFPGGQIQVLVDFELTEVKKK